MPSVHHGSEAASLLAPSGPQDSAAAAAAATLGAAAAEEVGGQQLQHPLIEADHPDWNSGRGGGGRGGSWMSAIFGGHFGGDEGEDAQQVRPNNPHFIKMT